MYEIIKNVILSGVFKLADMMTKIDTLWVQGDLTEEQRNELVILMQENVKPESETPEQATLYKQILEKYEALEKRVVKLENGGTEPEPPAGVEIPGWEPWDGISDRYKYGSVVSIDQKYYISCYQGQNTWMPGSMGTEGLWKEIPKEDAEAVIQGTKTPDEVIQG